MLGFGLSIEPQLWALVFVMIRIGATFIAAPVFGSVSVPLTVRVTLSGAIGFLVLAAHPIVPPQNIFAITQSSPPPPRRSSASRSASSSRSRSPRR